MRATIYLFAAIFAILPETSFAAPEIDDAD